MRGTVAVSELEEKVLELLSYFQVQDAEEWPYITIDTQDGEVTGPVSDELYQMLIDLYQLVGEGEE